MFTKSNFYTDKDYLRLLSIQQDDPDAPRSPFRRDYARLLHSPVFRRLQGKTQLFSGLESDFFRNRLTHSLEVSQIAHSIAVNLNAKFAQNSNSAQRKKSNLNLDLIDFSSIAHDLGHPPFGHTGEHVLNNLMREHGGFEGNAQTLHILARLEKRLDDPRVQMNSNHQPLWYKDNLPVSLGLNLCSRSLASIVKYDNEIPIQLDKNSFYKGYYASDKSVVDSIKKNVAPGFSGAFSTIECQIMDISDDIAYSTYDLDDALKGNLIEPLDLLFPEVSLLDSVAERAAKGLQDNTFDQNKARLAIHRALSEFKDAAGISQGTAGIGPARAMSRVFANNGLFRNSLTSNFVNRFVNGISFTYNQSYPALSTIQVDKEVHEEIEVLKHFTFLTMIESNRLKVVAHRAEHIVDTIFRALSSVNGHELLPPDFREMYNQANFDDGKPDQADKGLHCMRVLCDFVAGMTDRYAVEFYCRLRSENYQTIFKAI